jgi:hypothetical protein
MAFFASHVGESTCPLVALLGKDCPLCGGTRSLLLFHQLDWIAAWQLNPFVSLCCLIFWLFVGMAVAASFSVRAQLLFAAVLRSFHDKPLWFVVPAVSFYFLQGALWLLVERGNV